MNKLKPLIFCAIIVISAKLHANDNNEIIVSGSVCSYFPYEREKIIGVVGYYEPWFNPGVEVLYNKLSYRKGNLGIGINYQRAKFGARRHFVGRFKLEELSIPIVYNKPFSMSSKNRFALNLGIYNGFLLNYSAQSMGSTRWYVLSEEDITYSFSGKFFTDLYFDLDYSIIKSKIGILKITPFFKYRINKTLLNEYYRNVNGGLKLKFAIDL